MHLETKAAGGRSAWLCFPSSISKHTMKHPKGPNTMCMQVYYIRYIYDYAHIMLILCANSIGFHLTISIGSHFGHKAPLGCGENRRVAANLHGSR